jgi:hypothetical protein
MRPALTRAAACLAVLVAGCPGARTVAEDPMTDSTAAATAADTIHDLCALLASDPVTVEEVALRLGAITERLGEGMGLVVAPAAAWASTATVTPAPGGDAPHLVTLDVAPATPIAVDALARRLGPHETRRGHHLDDAPRAHWTVDDPSRPFTCSVAAELSGGNATTILLRRDPRLGE